MNLELQNERINYLKDKIYNDGTIVYVDDDMIPGSFAQDMKCIFGCNPETDILSGASRGDEDQANCTIVVLEKNIDRKELFVALSDYVNGTKIPYILCALPEEYAFKTEYEFEPDDKNVEGPVELIVGDCPVIDNNTNLLIEYPLQLGLEAGEGPSEVAKAIADGRHYTKELYDVNDEKLI